MRVTTREGTCIGSGRCNWLAPEVFGQDEDGFVLVLRDRPGEDLQERVRDAESGCPSRTIELGDVAEE